MESVNGNSFPTPTRDLAWKYVRLEKVGNTNNLICNFCGKVTKGGIYRAKQHIVGGYRNTTACSECPCFVRQEIKDFMEKKATTKNLEKIAVPSGFEDVDAQYGDDDMDARWRVGKKHKGQSFDVMTPTSPISSGDQINPKLEIDIEPINSKLSAVPVDDSLVTINGYKVKTSIASVLEAVFAKHGDIMAHCVCKSTSVRASLLEVTCNIVRRLQNHDVEAILSDLENMENEVSDLEASKIKVSWLHEHLARLRKIAGFKEKSFQLKKTKVRSGFVTRTAAKEMKQRHAELVLAQERFKEAEKRVNALRLVSRRIDDDIMECESEEYFWKRRLGDLI